MFEAATAARPKEEEPRREESEAAPLGAEVFKDVGQDQGGGGIGPGRCTVGGGAAPGNPEECRGSRRRDGGFATAVADAGCWVVQPHGGPNRGLMLEPIWPLAALREKDGLVSRKARSHSRGSAVTRALCFRRPGGDGCVKGGIGQASLPPLLCSGAPVVCRITNGVASHGVPGGEIQFQASMLEEVEVAQQCIGTLKVCGGGGWDEGAAAPQDCPCAA